MSVTGRLLTDSLPSTRAKILAALGFIGTPLAIFRFLLEVIPDTQKWSLWTKLLALFGVYAVLGFSFLIVLVLLALTTAYAKYPEDPDPHRRLLLFDAEQFGLVRTMYTTHTEIADDFSATIVYKTAVRAIASRVNGMEHFSTMPSRPQDVEGEIVIEAEDRREADTHIRPTVATCTPYECFFVLNFVPALRKGQEVTYSYTQRLPKKTFVASADGLKGRSLDFDYSTDMIKYPTERLISTVVFPNGFAPQWLRYDVWTGMAFQRHPSEYMRLENCGAYEDGYTENDRLYMKLDVPYPIRGLIYVLCWMPPKEGEGLEQKTAGLPRAAAPAKPAEPR